MNWRDVVGFEGRYEVSDTGMVRSLDRIIEHVSRHGGWCRRRALGKVLKPLPFPNGYVGVQLGNGGPDRRRLLVNRLVAQAFIPNPEDKPETNHKNGKRADNRVCNLEWVTASENRQHANAYLSPRPHKATQPVALVGGKGEQRQFSSLSSAARALGVTSGSTASAARHGHRCRGYEVRYAR